MRLHQLYDSRNGHNSCLSLHAASISTSKALQPRQSLSYKIQIPHAILSVLPKMCRLPKHACWTVPTTSLASSTSNPSCRHKMLHLPQWLAPSCNHDASFPPSLDSQSHHHMPFPLSFSGPTLPSWSAVARPRPRPVHKKAFQTKASSPPWHASLPSPSTP